MPFASDAASAEDLDLPIDARKIMTAPVPEGVRGLTCAVDCQNGSFGNFGDLWVGTGNPGVGLLGIASFTETPVAGKYGKNWVICSQRVGNARTARKQHILDLWDRCTITKHMQVENIHSVVSH